MAATGLSHMPEDWNTFGTLLDRGVGFSTALPRGLYFADMRTWLTRSDGCGRQSQVPEGGWIDLGGVVGVHVVHLEEMRRRREAVNVEGLVARWGEAVTIDRGGPVRLTLGSLLVADEELAAIAGPHGGEGPQVQRFDTSTEAAARFLKIGKRRLYPLAEEAIAAGVARWSGEGTERRHARWDLDQVRSWWAARTTSN
jgi:hypothetical protein